MFLRAGKRTPAQLLSDPPKFIAPLVWGVPRTLAIYTDWLWFADLGFETVFRTRLLAQAALFVLGGAAAFALLLGSAALARRLGDQAMGRLEFPSSAQVRAGEGVFTRVAMVFAAFVAFLMASSAAAARHASSD